MHNFLNLWAIDDALVGVDLQFTHCYELTPPDLEYQSEEEHLHYFQMIRNTLHALPEGATMQILVQVRKGDGETVDKYIHTVKTDTEVSRFLVNQKAEFFRSQSVERRRTFLFISTSPAPEELGKTQVTGFKFTNKNMRTITQLMHEKRLDQLNLLCREVVSQLRSLGIGIRQMQRDEILNFLYQYLNPSRSEFQPVKTYDPERTLRVQAAFNACEQTFSHIALDGYYYRAVNLFTRPEEIEFNMMLAFLGKLKADYDLCVTVHSLDQEAAAKKVQREATLSRIIGGLRAMAYIEADQKAIAAESLVSNAKENFQKIYQGSMAVILRNHDLSDLTADTNAVVQAFRLVGESEGIIDDMNHLQLYLSCLPGHSHLNIRKHYMLTDAVAQLLPLSAPWTGCAEPTILFHTDDKKLLPYDLFDPSLSAKHFLILGSTGSGKSFTTNMLLTNFYIQSDNNHVVIIDVGGSYRKLCSLYQGQYLSPDLSEPEKYAFNPFPEKAIAIQEPDEKHFEVEPDTLTYIGALVQRMLRVREFSGQEKMIIQKAITETYRTAPTDPPLLGHLEKNLIEFEGDEEDCKIAKGFAKNLKLWTTGSYGKMLNRPSTLNVNARFVVFDLQKLGEEMEDLKSIIVFIIKNAIHTKLHDKKLRKLIIFDEAWRLFNDPAGVILINDLYKTARKFNAAIGTISQSASDMTKCMAKDAIIENAYVKYILKLGGGFDLLPEFKLTDEDIAHIKDLRSEKGIYSEVFVRFDKNRRVIRIRPSPTDYWVCTTDADDENTEKSIRLKNPNFSEIDVLQELSKRRK